MTRAEQVVERDPIACLSRSFCKFDEAGSGEEENAGHCPTFKSISGDPAS